MTENPLMLIAASAAFVGLIHSLSPGHWLPVVLVARSRRWGMRQALGGALVAAAGHISVSLALAATSIFVGAQLIDRHEERLENWASIGVIAFGLAYATWAYFRHSSCHGHEHHGPDAEQGARRGPYVFLFTLGFSPCVAALPVFGAAAARGFPSVALAMAAFCAGVVLALAGATAVVSRGFMKIDHPIFEHYGDVITGLAVAALGVALRFMPHVH